MTLFHWDTPQALEDLGGWPARDTVDAFSEYVEVVTERLGDRVRNWITHNEPWVVAWIGHGWGHHAPGRTSEPDALATAHHLLLSHGRAVEIIRRTSPGSQVGITLNLDHAYAASGDPADVAAAHWVDGFHNRWFLDPIFRGAYPEDMAEAWAATMPEIRDGDLETIAAPIDFLGVNNYSSPLVAADPNGGRSQIVHRPDAEHTDMGWEITPDGLHDLLVRLSATTRPRPSTSPRTERPSRMFAATTARSATSSGRRISTPTSRRPAARSRQASRSAGTSPGRCSTTSSGPGATGSASA